MPTIEAVVEQIERHIRELKAERDGLIKDAGLNRRQIERILKMRSPKRTICQLLRELHDDADWAEREKIERCLLIAKKMDDRLMECAGRQYHKDWYDDDGEFIES